MRSLNARGRVGLAFQATKPLWNLKWKRSEVTYIVYCHKDCMSGPESHGEWVWVRESTSLSKAILSSPRYVLWWTHTSHGAWAGAGYWLAFFYLRLASSVLVQGPLTLMWPVAGRLLSESVWGWDEPGL